MKFAHMADCHLGSWSSHPEMKNMPLVAFENAIDQCIAEDVDFIIIAGDLLDTSLPGVDVLSKAAAIFHKCREAAIPVYLIAGSHDYSPTGKTMLSVFENAGLVIDVAKYEEDNEKIQLKFTIDKKTGAKITGLFGRKGSLEIDSFRKIDKSIEEGGDKIFVFHCGIDEHSAMMGSSSVPVSLLPEGFDYYATGHIHIKKIYETIRGKVAFPGPLFPTSFDELENYDSGFYIVEKKENHVSIDWRSVKLFDTLLIERDATDKTPNEVESSVIDALGESSLNNTVVLVKLRGALKSGKPSDIDFKLIASKATDLGAIIMKKNISKLSSSEMEEVAVDNITNLDELEKKIIAEHAGRMKLSGKKDIEHLLLGLMNILKEEKGEDETNASYEEKIKENTKRLLEL